MTKYSYKLENEVYRLYEDETPISTPDGNPIIAESEPLAQKLVEALEAGEDFTSPDSLLTFHYTYCNLIADYKQEDLIADYTDCMCYDNLLGDAYLMFRQPSPVRQSVATYLDDNSMEFFMDMNMYQITAVLTLYTISHSWALPYYVVADLVEHAGTEDYADLKEDFMNDIVECELSEYNVDPNEASYKRHLKELSKAIDLFVEYFTLQ